MNGKSKLLLNGKLINLTELNNTEHLQFEIIAQKAIAKALGKKVTKIIKKRV